MRIEFYIPVLILYIALWSVIGVVAIGFTAMMLDGGKVNNKFLRASSFILAGPAIWVILGVSYRDEWTRWGR